MSDLSEFEFKSRAKQTHPKGFEPGIQWDGKTGTITAALAEEPDDAVWAQLIEDWGLDPRQTMVVDGSLQIRAWDSNAGNGDVVRMKYYRCTIAPRVGGVERADVELLCSEIMKRKPSKPVQVTGSRRAFLVLLSDWQIGKGCEIRGGTAETVARIGRALDEAHARLKELIKLGKAPSAIYLIGLGDLVEGCSGDWYANQTWVADANDREQDRIARRLVLQAIDTFVDFGLPVVAAGVPGNHGENRKAGKAFTDWSDNRDLTAFETVGEIIAQNPARYGHVSMPSALNEDDLSLTLDLAGVPVSFIHGHQLRSGANSQGKMEGWWKSQALGRTQVSDAELLCSGHFHHFVMSEGTGRTVLQVPAMDGGSKWFTATSGQSSQAGMVTLLVGADTGARGWSDLLIV